MKLSHQKNEQTSLKKNETPGLPQTSDFQKQLAAVLPEMAAAAYEETQHLAVLDAEGSKHPEPNYLTVTETLAKFKTDFLPLSPLIDPRKRRVAVIKNNFPKFLNLCPKVNPVVNGETVKKRATTIVEEIERGGFVEGDYKWESDRLHSIFWIADVIRDPDAIYKKKDGFGQVPAKEVYLKVYKRQNVGSPVKVVFTNTIQRGKGQVWMVVTSYFTSRSSAKSYTDGPPLYLRPQAKEPLK